MTNELATIAPTPAEVQADIDSLKAELANIADHIFALEQESNDYKAVLANPQAGADRLARLAMLRERQRSIEIALQAARAALEDAEAVQFRIKLTETRNGIKDLIAKRNEAGHMASAAVAQLAGAVRELIHTSHETLGALNSGANGVITEKGRLVLAGASALNDLQMVQHWVQLAMHRALGPQWPYDRTPAFGWHSDIAEAVEDIGRNVLREWDAANRTRMHGVIDHDPAEQADPAEGSVPVSVSVFDEDPTEDDLAAIAAMDPAEAARAIRSFSRSKWARDNALNNPTA